MVANLKADEGGEGPVTITTECTTTKQFEKQNQSGEAKSVISTFLPDHCFCRTQMTAEAALAFLRPADTHLPTICPSQWDGI